MLPKPNKFNCLFLCKCIIKECEGNYSIISLVEHQGDLILYTLVSRTPGDLILYTLVSRTPGGLIQYTLVSGTPGDLIQYTLVSRSPGEPIQYTLVNTTPGDLYSIISLVEHQGTVEICSPHPKFVLTVFYKREYTVHIIFY